MSENQKQPSSSNDLTFDCNLHNNFLYFYKACFKQSFPVVTLYTNLGEDAVAHGLNETKVETVLTTHELMPKFRNILEHTPHVKKIVYFENALEKTDISGYRSDVELVAFWDVVSMGKKNKNCNNNDQVRFDLKFLFLVFSIFDHTI